MAFMDDPLGSLGLGNIKGGIYDIAVYVIWGLVILAVVIFIYLKYQDKKIYKYPVRILRQRNNGQVKETNTFGGYVKKQGITQFIIKMGRFKKKNAERLPLSEYMDEDERVYYYQISPESPLIQTKRDFIVEEVFVKNENFIEPTLELKEEIIKNYTLRLKLSEDYKNREEEELKSIAKNILEGELEKERKKMINVTRIKYSPIPTDQKQATMLELANLRNTLGVDVNKQFAYFISGVIGLVVLGIVIFYIAVNKGSLPILEIINPLLLTI